MIGFYRFLTNCSRPFLKQYLKKRVACGKEDPTRLAERHGYGHKPRPEGPLLWFHGASVGESLSLLPLLDRIRNDYPSHHVLVTTGTVTSAALMAARLPSHAFHRYVPLDYPQAVERFLDHWRPDAAFWVESELWPNLILATKARHIPMTLLNARLSARSCKRWSYVQGSIKKILDAFRLIISQTPQDQQHFEKLGAQAVHSLGNLKYAAPPLPANQQALTALQETIEDRPLWLAASTHDGDETLAATVHKELKGAHPTLLTLIAPRHPERGSDIAKALTEQGLSISLRSKNEPITPETDIYIADTMGEMGLWYRLSPHVFIGKSLGPRGGGQNPLEPARLNCALLAGPRMDNFAAITEHFVSQDALVSVETAADLARSLDLLLKHPQQQQALADQALKVAAQEDTVLEAYAQALAPILDTVLRARRGQDT